SNIYVAGNNPSDPLSQVSITGATVSGNGRLGVLVNDVAPVLLSTMKIINNGTAMPGGIGLGGGIDVQKSQVAGMGGYLFTLTTSQVTANKGCGVSVTGGFSSIGGGTGAQICGVAAAGTGGPTAANLTSNTISGNSGVGVYITE